MDPNEARRLRELEQESRRLKAAAACEEFSFDFG
jgi:hypothetical protein